MKPLRLSAADRARVEDVMRPAKTEKRILLRCQALLLLADGVALWDVARLLGVDRRTVGKWRVRFDGPDPVSRLADAPRSGRPRALSRSPSPHA